MEKALKHFVHLSSSFLFTLLTTPILLPRTTMTTSQAPVFRLDYKVQSYDWGKVGSSSKVAKFAASSPGFDVDENRPYAEVSCRDPMESLSLSLVWGSSLRINASVPLPQRTQA